MADPPVPLEAMRAAELKASLQAMAKPACEHYWADHCYDGLSVRLCQLCHEPDWDDLRRQLAAEREACAQLADQVKAHYMARGDDQPDGEPSGLVPFADLLRKEQS